LTGRVWIPACAGMTTSHEKIKKSNQTAAIFGIGEKEKK
jgi:hypothetical protein